MSQKFRKGQFLDALMVCCFFCCPLFSGPLLIVGEGSATVKGGMSYDFLSDPLRKPFDYGQARVTINFPVNISRPMHTFIEKAAGENLAVPTFTARAAQNFNTSLDVSSPLFGGAAFFAVRENASLNIRGALGNANISIDTVKGRDGGRVLLKGGINIPLRFDMSWRSYTFGYTHKPTKNVRIGFQVHKHMFYASTAGNLQTTLTGRLEQVTSESSFSGTIPYGEDQIFGFVDGEYAGEAWVPEIGISYGPVSFVSRMGLEIKADGFLNSLYSVPFFIDEETLLPRYTEPDSFLTPENIPKLMNADVVSNEYRIVDNLSILVPQSHTIAFDLIPDKLILSYTKVYGKLETKTTSDSTQIDSLSFSTEDFLDVSLKSDHVTMLMANFSWFRHNIGFSLFDVSYRSQKDLYSEILEDFGIPPLMPIWNFGFNAGHKGSFTLDFFHRPFTGSANGISICILAQQNTWHGGSYSA